MNSIKRLIRWHNETLLDKGDWTVLIVDGIILLFVGYLIYFLIGLAYIGYYGALIKVLISIFFMAMVIFAFNVHDWENHGEPSPKWYKKMTGTLWGQLIIAICFIALLIFFFAGTWPGNYWN